MLSIVVPLCNEDESLATLYAELAEMAARQSYDLEILFIDDGSTDRSWQEIHKLAERDPRVRGIRFRRNFGKAAALSAGFAAARGEQVVTIDADLQDDPREIPQLLAVMNEGYDVVSGWKKKRHDPWHKVFPSRVFNGMVSWLTGVRLHDHNCGLKAYRREVFGEVRLYGELHRFVPVLAHARGFKVGEAVVQHRPRRYGHSKYGVRRFMKGFLDLLTVKFLTGFSQRPQHFLGAIGLLCWLLGGAGLVYLGGYWIVEELQHVDPKIHERALLLYSLGAMVFGAQLMSIGFLAELIIAYQGRDAETYSISELVGQVPPQTPAASIATPPPTQHHTSNTTIPSSETTAPAPFAATEK
ncbi:MAG TPA: glycosyltransferase family 2 protein [Pirellulales bacterium]|jgi:dolichol-phosphate mannosyltransferase|nr:glycosyltransferase family 2 protein [Pirellulales bacterium]